MRLDDAPESENVEDRRGARPAMVAGGGIGALILAAVVYFLTGDPNQAKQVAQQVGQQRPAAQQDEGPPPKDGVLEFSKKILGLTDEVWAEQFQLHGRRPYERPHLELFSHAVDTGCGHAPSEVGPFYCP